MNLRGLANRKLYHASILIRMLGPELGREDLPAHIVLEAVGLAVRQHLLEAYGWFLLELAGVDEPAGAPPAGVAALQRQYTLDEPLRGELVELLQLEKQGWLAELLSHPQPGGGIAARDPDRLAVVEQSWSEDLLRNWHDRLSDLIDRLGHGLDEW